MANLMSGFGNSIVNFLNFNRSRKDNSGLVRMFETEYRREYNWARKAGTEINDDFVRSFLAARKSR